MCNRPPRVNGRPCSRPLRDELRPLFRAATEARAVDPALANLYTAWVARLAADVGGWQAKLWAAYRRVRPALVAVRRGEGGS